MGRSGISYRLRRVSRLVLLFVLAIVICCVAYAATPPPDVRHRLSMATAYAALCFLGGCLVLGPWNILRRLSTPVSYDLRRDVGIVAGILALLHTAIGLTVHLRGRMWMYFFKSLHPLHMQANGFGAANYTGLAAAVLFTMLLAISNDWSLRALGTKRWKTLQRWTYVAFGLTVVHSVLFQWVEKRHLPWVIVLTALGAITLVAQGIGYGKRRQLSAK